jgi:TonB-linked SusC/RagA family outer membrane protein
MRYLRSCLILLPLMAAFPVTTSAQAVGNISGRLINAQTGQPISAAQVFVEGTTLGGLSSQEGRYAIQNVPAGTHTLMVQLIGYRAMSAEIAVVSGQTVVRDFRMSEEAVALDAIVVTGIAGGERRRAVGNAVGTVEGASVASEVPVLSTQDLLRGRAPSVSMMGGGMVGQAPRIRIRGASTLSLAGNPLIYIDGVRANRSETSGYAYGNNDGMRGMLSTLDPEQIEKIEVLKGPAAATLYGTEASRGVINIVTKRGVAGRAKVDVMIRQGTSFIANPASRVGKTNYWMDPTTKEVSSLNMIDYLHDQGVDIFGYGPTQEFSGTLSGGSPDTKYFFSGTYSREVGVLSWNWANKLNVRSNIDAQLSEAFGVGLSMGFTNSRDRMATDGYGSVLEGIQFGNPGLTPDNRCRTTNNAAGCDLLNGFTLQSLPAKERSLFNTQELNRFTGSLTFNHKAFGWLASRLIVGLDYTGELNVAYRDYQTMDTVITSLGANAAKGFRNEGRREHFLTTTDFSATATRDLTERLASATSVGVQYYTRTESYLNATGEQFAGPGLSTITATSIRGVPGNNSTSDKTLGAYAQETFTWQDRLFLTGAVRVDNNSAFGDKIDFVTYPKFSLSWVMNEEGWFQDLAPSWLNGLRLRGAWGQSGEQPASFSALRTWGAVTGPNNTAGVSPSTLGNPDLTAEVGEETELGFDSNFLDGRLGLEFTYYHKLTRKAILERTLAPSSGFTGTQFFNAGRILNTGLESSLNAVVLDRPGLRWNLGFNFSYNSAEVQQLSGDPGDTAIVFNSWSSMEHRVGHAPYSWFGAKVVSAELDPVTYKAINAMCDNGAGGTTPCFDANGKTIAPRVDLGRAIAPVEMSLSTDVSVGDGLRFHALFTSEQGHKRFDNTDRQRCRLNNTCRANVYPAEWDPMVRATVQSSDGIVSSWIHDVSFVRLKEVSVTYTLSQDLVRRLGMSHAEAQLAGRNLLTFTDWPQADPEVMFTSGSRAFMEQNNMPLAQQITTSFRFSF